MKRRQRDFFEKDRNFKPGRLSHGGTRRGEPAGRKLKRPFDRKHPLHLTMRAECAKGRLSMLAPSKRFQVDELVQREAKKNGVTIHRFANVGNHLHLVARFRSHESFKRFLRTVTGLIARLITGARKGKSFGRFWDGLAHSRVLIGRKSFVFAMEYGEANEIEAKEGTKARQRFLIQKKKSRRRSNE